MAKNTGETKPFYIWEGVYDSFQSASVEAVGPGFSGEIYRKRSLSAARECIEALNAGRPIPQFHKQRSTLLPVTIAMMLGSKERIRVLDFGGGLGIGYMTCAESIPCDLKRTDYSIVEDSEVGKVGESLLGGRVEFLSSLPSSEYFDLVHAASSLQYIEHWHDLLGRFASFCPDYILLSDVFAGAISSFVTLQNYYGSRIPHWFLNLQELLDEFERGGYRLIMQSYVASRRLNVEDNLPMDNFPENQRLSQTMHLLLKKN